jgi:hypothetical protein
MSEDKPTVTRSRKRQHQQSGKGRPKGNLIPNLTIEFDTTILKEIKSTLGAIVAYEIEWGILNGETYPDGHPVADRMHKHEYGLPIKMPDGSVKQLPPRPAFMQSILREGRGEAQTNSLLLFQKALSNEKIGKFRQWIAANMAQTVKNEIDRQQFKELSEVTVAKKGHDTILKDTEKMYDSITGKSVRKKQPKKDS